MPIEELQEPIWEKQKGETPNQYCYFLEFLEYPTYNLKDFHDHLSEKNKKEQQGTKIVSYGTLRKWAMESCNNWHTRKQAKRASEKKDILETLHELDKYDKIEEFKLKKSFKNKLLKRLNEEAESERYSQLKHGVDAYVHINDDNRVDKEEPTTFTKTEGTLEVESETTLNNPGLNKIAEAYLNGRKQHNNESTS